MYGRRKTDKALLFVAMWAILLGLTNMAIDCRMLKPITEVSVTDRIAVILVLPTLAVLTTVVIFFFLKSRLQG